MKSSFQHSNKYRLYVFDYRLKSELVCGVFYSALTFCTTCSILTAEDCSQPLSLAEVYRTEEDLKTFHL